MGAVQGLTPDDVQRQGDEIAAANEQLAPFRVLRGIECDVLADGRLDLADDIPAGLAGRGERARRAADAAAELTKRVEDALRNPYVRCLSQTRAGTSTGGRRTSSTRSACFQVAWEERVALEVNGLPVRLDLSGESVRDALSAGVPIVCSTDARSVRGLENMTLAVATARRGWATAAHVVDSYEPATGCARRFRFEPTEQELTSGSRVDRLCTAGHQPRSCSHKRSHAVRADCPLEGDRNRTAGATPSRDLGVAALLGRRWCWARQRYRCEMSPKRKQAHHRQEHECDSARWTSTELPSWPERLPGRGGLPLSGNAVAQGSSKCMRLRDA